MSAQQNGVISIQPKTVEAAEAVIKRLFAKHARVRARIDELTAEHRTAAYHVHVNSDADAYKRLDRINDELAQRKRELHDLDAALVEAHARRDAAQLAVAKSDAARRIRHAGELQCLAPIRSAEAARDNDLDLPGRPARIPATQQLRRAARPLRGRGSPR